MRPQAIDEVSLAREETATTLLSYHVPPHCFTANATKFRANRGPAGLASSPRILGRGFQPPGNRVGGHNGMVDEKLNFVALAPTLFHGPLSTCRRAPAGFSASGGPPASGHRTPDSRHADPPSF